MAMVVRHLHLEAAKKSAVMLRGYCCCALSSLEDDVGVGLVSSSASIIWIFFRDFTKKFSFLLKKPDDFIL